MKTRLLLTLAFVVAIVISVAASVAISDTFFDDSSPTTVSFGSVPAVSSTPCAAASILRSACKTKGGEACTAFMECVK